MSSWELPSCRTVHDLYLERDGLPWYLRFLATASSWLVFAGYVIFPLVFTSKVDDLYASSMTLTSFGATLLVVGYVLLLITAVVLKNPLFRLDAVYLPTLTSSVLGLFTILLNLTLHPDLPFRTALIYLPLTFSTVSTLVSASLAMWTYRTITLIKASDNHRWSHRSQRGGSWPGPTDDASTADLLPHKYQLPSDELQRQQLLRLLLKREEDRSHSPDVNSSTYKIDIPLDTSSATPQNPTHNRFLSLPFAAGGRDRTSSQGNERTTWQIQNLRNLLPSRKSNCDIEIEVERLRSPREKRREEIENASRARIQQFAPPGGWPAPTNPGAQPHLQSQESWDGAARYA